MQSFNGHVSFSIQIFNSVISLRNRFNTNSTFFSAYSSQPNIPYEDFIATIALEVHCKNDLKL